MGMKNRRKAGGDRRSFRQAPAFPFADTNGCLLHDCRSRKPDRRLNNLSAKWISMALVHAHFISKREHSHDEEAVEAVPLPGNTRGKTA
jgi:hypothetical protein